MSEQSEKIHESKQAKRAYSEHTCAMEELHIGSQVAFQHPQSKLWGIYGTITAVGPLLYQTQSRQVLVHNRQFTAPPP